MTALTALSTRLLAHRRHTAHAKATERQLAQVRLPGEESVEGLPDVLVQHRRHDRLLSEHQLAQRTTLVSVAPTNSSGGKGHGPFGAKPAA